MATLTNAFTTYSAQGNREDLSDIIYDVSPTETPFLTAIKKVKAKGQLHEWQIDALASASATNFVIQGEDATVDAATATTRLTNRCCISDKVPAVTGTQESVDKAGRKSEMAYQMKKRMKEIKRDVESALLANNVMVIGTTSVASECAGLDAYITTNTDKAGDATNGSAGTTARTEGTQRALTEAMVEEVLADAWNSGGSPTLGILGSWQKRKFSGFSGNASRQSNATEKKITNTIDVYIDPMGSEIRLVPCRQVPARTVHFIDPEYMAFAALRDFQSWDLAKTGDSVKKQILVEYTLEVCNEKAHAAVYDLTTS